MLRTLLNEQTKYESLKDECSLLGNVEQIWAPFMNGRSEVSIFLATKTGALITYDAHSEIGLPHEKNGEVYYDFTSSSWYSQCVKSEREGFTNIYDDHYGRGKMITVFSPFYDADGKFAGAIGLDVNGNLEHRAEIISNDEIGELVKNFNDMTESLRKYIANLADVTAEKERIGAELNIATKIQADMLPKIIPPYLNHEAFDINGTYELLDTMQIIALAVMEGTEFTESEFWLGHLDTLYLYTDGVTEATNINKELYGTDRMIEELNRTVGAPANEVLTIMNKSVMNFTGEDLQFDDLTMMCLQFFGKPDELTIEAEVDKLHNVIAFVDEYLEKWGCPMTFVTEIELAVEEIFVNIAHYS